MTISLQRRAPLERARYAADRIAGLQLQSVILADMRAEAIADAVHEGRSRAEVARELGISWQQVSKAIDRAARLAKERT